MPVPEVLLGEQSRASMLRGFTSMARLMAITLGPMGGKVASEKIATRDVEILTDAATIARRIIQLPDRAEDAGAMIMRHMVWRVRQEVGDGSATTAVLAQAIASEMQRIVVAGANSMIVKRGVQWATAEATKALEEMTIPLQGEDRIAAVATAATGDGEIGKLLGEVYDVLGPHANIVIQPYIATSHDRAYFDGARFKGGYLSPYLLTDVERRTAVLDDVYVLIADVEFDTIESVQNILEQVLRAGGKSVFFVCKKMSDKAIGVLAVNNERGAIQSCAATVSSMGDARRETFENIAVLTGGSSLTTEAGMTLADITLRDLGRAKRVIATHDHYMIIGGQGDREAIRERMQRLRQRLRDNYDPDQRTALQGLLSHFSAGVAELRIGALTPQDRQALQETAEQSMKAVAAGMESGVVPGGGAAYLSCIPAVEAVQAKGDEALGVKIVARALEEPMRCIANSAGVHPPLAIAQARKLGPGYGLDVRSKQVVDMMAEGIMDPTSVAKRALELASSGAAMLLTTEALVLHRKPEETHGP